MTSLRFQLEEILCNYTNECIEDILNNVKPKYLKRFNKFKYYKKDVLKYLQNKHNLLHTCFPKGQINYWIMRGFTIEYAKEKIKEYSHVYSTLNVESIMKRHNVNEEEAKKIKNERLNKVKFAMSLKSKEELEEINSKKSNSLKQCVKRYGEIKGTEKYKEYCKNKSLNTSLEGYIKRYGEIKGIEEYNKLLEKRKGASSKDWYIKKYGNIVGLEKYNEVSKRKSYSHTLNGYISKYGFDDGIKKYNERNEKYLKSIFSKSKDELEKINSKKSFGLEQYKEKYGNEYGEILYNNKKQKLKFKASKKSLKVFVPFYNWLLLEKHIDQSNIYFGYENKKEYFLTDGKIFYSYDFTILNDNIIVEYNGVCFHPKSETDETFKNPFNKNLTSKDAYTYDANKIKFAEERGFKVLTLWEDTTDSDNLLLLRSFYEENCNNV